MSWLLPARQRVLLSSPVAKTGSCFFEPGRKNHVEGRPWSGCSRLYLESLRLMPPLRCLLPLHISSAIFPLSRRLCRVRYGGGGAQLPCHPSRRIGNWRALEGTSVAGASPTTCTNADAKPNKSTKIARQPYMPECLCGYAVPQPVTLRPLEPVFR